MPQPQSSQINYGERLYQRGVKKREEKEMIVRQARSEQHRKEIEQFSFRPETNHKGQGQRGQKTEDLLINYGKRRDEILNFQRAMKAHQEV